MDSCLSQVYKYGQEFELGKSRKMDAFIKPNHYGQDVTQSQYLFLGGVLLVLT